MRRIVCLFILCLVLSAQSKLVPEEFIVRPGAVRFWRFAVSDSARVAGRFHARGGSGNDIQVIVAEWDECENWINGNQGTAFYASGKVTNGKMDVELGSGNYCIAFNNRMSTVSAKEIAAQIFIERR